MNPRELNTRAREQWDAKAEFWDVLHGYDGNQFHKQLVGPSAERLLAVKAGESVLDVACGNGQFSRRLAALGAQVTAICSGRGLELAKEAGAQRVIDRKSVQVPGSVQGKFDLVFDPSAAYRWSQWKHALNPKGHFVTTLPSLNFMVDKLASLFASTGVHFVNVKCNPAHLELLGRWLAEGLNVHVDHVVEVRDVGKSLARLHAGGVVGRVVVDVHGKL